MQLGMSAINAAAQWGVDIRVGIVPRVDVEFDFAIEVLPDLPGMFASRCHDQGDLLVQPAFVEHVTDDLGWQVHVRDEQVAIAHQSHVVGNGDGVVDFFRYLQMFEVRSLIGCQAALLL